MSMSRSLSEVLEATRYLAVLAEKLFHPSVLPKKQASQKEKIKESKLREQTGKPLPKHSVERSRVIKTASVTQNKENVMFY